LAQCQEEGQVLAALPPGALMTLSTSGMSSGATRSPAERQTGATDEATQPAEVMDETQQMKWQRAADVLGFLFVDIVSILLHNYSDDELDIPAVRSLIRASFQMVGYQEWKDWQFRRLEMAHPIYHCFYDVNSLPRGMRDMHYSVAVPLTPDYLEGIVVGDQLVGVYSMKGYADFWSGLGEQERETFDVVNSPFLASAEEPLAYNLGVNMVVYALTREGSLAQQLVDAD
jgi:hypothetical protein